MGLIEDSLYIVTSAFAASLMLLFGLYAIGQVGDVPALATPSAAIIEQNFTYLDGIMVIGVIGLSLAALILAFFIPSHPIFFGISYVVAVIVLIVISPVYSNAYALAAQLGPIAAAGQSLPYTAQIMGNLPIIAIVVSALIALVSYAKRPGDNVLAGI